MERCKQCQDLMLEYLYDLLEGAERQEFLDHLGQCAACQAALERARGQQKLLAAAARMPFPEVRFEPPRTEPAAPTVSAVVVKMPSRRRWVHWAVAAGILIAAVGLVLPGAHHWNQYAAARRIVDEHQAAVAHIQRDLAGVREQLNRLPQLRQERLNEVENQVRERQLKLDVRGPRTVQPGAPNEYRIAAKNLNDQVVSARADVRIRDQNRNIVYEEKGIVLEGEHRLILPRDLPLPPGTQLALEVAARREGGPPSQVHAALELAPPLYLTHLTTDKPMYQPGETVRFRSLTLERFSLRPPEARRPQEPPFHLIYTLTRPTGEEAVIATGTFDHLLQEDPQTRARSEIRGPDGQPIRGIGTGEWLIPPNADGGEYTLTVREASGRFPPQQRKFLVNRYQPHRLNKELDYARKSYGPGEEVVAVCKASRAEGGPVANRPVEATVLIDGKTYGADGRESDRPILFRTDDQGKVEVRFRLPAVIEKGQASLSVKFNDGAGPEPITRPIPIVLKKLHVEFFPEGGDLVAGAPNRVYFQVRSTLGKPADLKGRLVDQDGNIVAEGVETLTDKENPGVNQGQGVFTFTPQPGRRYELKIDSPAGIEGRYLLPEVKEDGVVLSIPGGVFRADEPIRVVLHSPGRKRTLLVGSYCRGRLLDHRTVTARPDGPTEVVLKPASVGGVYRVTVFEERPGPGDRREFVPLAERLVYRRPPQRLELALHPDKKQYVPGDTVRLSVTGATEDDRPAPAIVMLAVVDKSVLTLADEKTRRSMPTHFYLTTEVRKAEDLEYADFLLTAHPRAPEALDLLLGTQGWRRFAEQNPDQFRQKYGDEAERLLTAIGQSRPETPLVVTGQPGPETRAFEQREKLRVQEEIQKEHARLVEQLNAAQQQLAAVQRDTEYLAAADAVGRYEKMARTLRQLGGLLLAVALAVAAVACLIVGIRRSPVRGVLAGGAVLGVLSVVVIVLLFNQREGPMQMAKEAASLGAAGVDDARVEAYARMKPPEEAPLAAEAEGDRPVKMMVEIRRDNPDRPRSATGAAPPPTAPAPDMMPIRKLHMDALKKAPKETKEDRALLERLFREDAGKARPRLDEADDLARRRGEQRQANIRDEKARLQEEARRRLAKEFQPMLREAAAGFRGGPAPALPFIVRQYAHRHQPGPDGERSVFTETVYWHPVLVLPDGKAEVQFDLSDSVTTFEVTAYGHTLDGRLGAATATIQSRLPFTLEPRVPIEVTASDKIDLPVSIANNTPEPREVAFRVEHPGLKLLDGKSHDRLTLAGDSRTRRILRFQPAIIEGQAEVLIEGKTEPFAADRVRRSFQVVPEGFPVVGSKSDLLEGAAINEVVLPETWVPGTLKCQVQVYPSTLASLQKGLESLLREPHGCFEQTSTSNYPNLLILDYLRESDLARPEIDRRARDLLARGYQKLISFECQNPAKGTKEGYEWFGGTAPPHEALTAYGLLQFRDMARVHDVDPVMVERTRQYLMNQRDGRGGFKRNPRALDTFGRAPDDITNAYIVWALTESGQEDDVSKELAVLTEQAKASKDPYFISLVANSLLNRDQAGTAVALLKAVAAAQKPDGHLDAERTSITGSGGRDLQIETTALAVLGWLKANRPADFNTPIQNAIRWIGQQRGGFGGFGSTQSTILALKALIAYTRANKRPVEPGELRLVIGEQEVAKLAFGTDAVEALTLNLPEPEKHLRPGSNRVRIEVTGRNVFPYTLAWSYQTLKPASAEGCPVRLSTTLDRTTANEGDAVRLTVTLANVSGKGQGMTVAIIGLPGGLTVPESLKQLKEHCLLRDNDTKPGLISAFEIRGRELVLYWRDLAPGQKIEVPIDLECRLPGEYRGPASRAYLYYNADHKHWVDPLRMVIKPGAE